jgi:hypothetical protein
MNAMPCGQAAACALRGIAVRWERCVATQRTIEHGFDAAVVERENHQVVLVQVKARPVERCAAILPKELMEAGSRGALVLAIDPSNIRLFKPGEANLGDPIADLDTRQVLEHYDSGFPGKRVFESYLRTLVEASLRDLAYHWKSEHPAGSWKSSREAQHSALEADMDVFVYVETNFLIGVAMGREVGGA